MPNAQALREAAIEYAQGELSTDSAVSKLLELCGDKRVAVVLARQQFDEDLKTRPEDPVITRAADLLDRVLERLPLG